MASIEADLGNGTGNSFQMAPVENDDDYRKRVMRSKYIS